MLPLSFVLSLTPPRNPHKQPLPPSRVVCRILKAHTRSVIYIIGKSSSSWIPHFVGNSYLSVDERYIAVVVLSGDVAGCALYKYLVRSGGFGCQWVWLVAVPCVALNRITEWECLGQQNKTRFRSMISYLGYIFVKEKRTKSILRQSSSRFQYQ